MTNFAIAEALAADLAGASVDPNEAQKALAYLRSKRDPKLFFTYLDAVVTNGHVVIRSRQTLDYYRDLQQIFRRHLSGMSYEELAPTLGWGLRLLRYYRAVPEAIQRQTLPTPPLSREVALTQAPPAPRPATRREPPAVGDEFTGKVLDGDAQVFVIQVPGFTEQEAVAVLKIEPGTPKFRIGKDSAKVKVVAVRQAKSGKTILEVRRPT
ncbi:MAG: hypothetical protein AB4911_05950 [Oscillochloridaceae bacterium umkhey_bin13]